MLVKSEKKSKKRKRSASTIDLGGKKGDVCFHDLSFKEKKLSFVVTGKERDKTKMEIKAPGKSEDCNIKSKRQRSGGTQPRVSSTDSCEDVMENVVEAKYKLTNERETVHDTLLDTKSIIPKTASETCDSEVVETLGEGSDGNVIDLVTRNRRKKDKRKKGDGQVDIVTGVNRGDVSTIEETEDSKIDDANIRKRKSTKPGHNSKDPTLEKSEKRVWFSGHVQVFSPSSDSSDKKHEVKDESLLQGKRFTREEDEIIKDAVYRYIEVHNLGEEGLQKILDSRYNPEVRGCWKEIGSAIPYRPNKAVSQRAPKLFLMGERRRYTEEEFEMIRKYHREHGPKWKVLADELGRHGVHVHDAWRRIKLARKKGNWSQEEMQTLFNLVNTDLQLKLSDEKKSNHGMLRDNICWSAISDRLTTRDNSTCCNKWYRQLTSPMVATGEWADTDDYRLIGTLFELDASCLEDVDWDDLLDHRPGELCRKRWNQMVRQLSHHENKSFAEQVEVLAKRYRPELVGAREAWDNKPVVP